MVKNYTNEHATKLIESQAGYGSVSSNPVIRDQINLSNANSNTILKPPSNVITNTINNNTSNN